MLHDGDGHHVLLDPREGVDHSPHGDGVDFCDFYHCLEWESLDVHNEVEGLQATYVDSFVEISVCEGLCELGGLLIFLAVHQNCLQYMVIKSSDLSISLLGFGGLSLA